MASLRQRKGVWHVQFLWGGRKFERSLRTKLKKHAERLKGRIELQIDGVRQGLVTPPVGADEAEWIFSAGQRDDKPGAATDAVRTVGELLDRFSAAMPEGARASNTVGTEKTHHKHLRKVLGARTVLSGVGVAQLQRYVSDRKAEPVTIKKELASLRVAWRWGHDAEVAPAPPRFDKIVYPKRPQQPPFRHAEQIRREIDARKLKGKEAEELWESLVLTLDEVRDLVSFVRAMPHQWFADVWEVAAYTGMRRSELCRMMGSDIDVGRGEIRVREKKRVKSRSESYRVVRIAATLKPTAERLARSPGHVFLFRREPVIPDQIRTQWRDRRVGTPWEHVAGLHVLRHSFASNLAMKGVSQSLIDAWMGHTTEEMRGRYRHFFPAETDKAIDALG